MASRKTDDIEAVMKDGKPSHDKKDVKAGVRNEFKERFEGKDYPPNKTREQMGIDGKYDKIVNEPPSWEEFVKNLNDLKNRRAAGIDQIRNELLKNSGERMKHLLYIFICEIFTTGFIPEDLNHGRVKLLFKSGDPLNPGNYRPITVSSVIIKLFTKIYQTRLSSLFEDEGLLEDNQIGFRPGRGTADAIAMVNTLIVKHKKKKSPIHLAFLDLTSKLYYKEDGNVSLSYDILDPIFEFCHVECKKFSTSLDS